MIPVTLVIWFNFLLPVPPCLDNSDRYGTISAASNWIIICAVMYGVTPNANILARWKAPPLIASNTSSTDIPLVLALTPGTIIAVPILNTNNAAKVNNILFCKSLFFELNICFNVANILNHLCFSTLSFYFTNCRFWKFMCFYSDFFS